MWADRFPSRFWSLKLFESLMILRLVVLPLVCWFRCILAAAAARSDARALPPDSSLVRDAVAFGDESADGEAAMTVDASFAAYIELGANNLREKTFFSAIFLW